MRIPCYFLFLFGFLSFAQDDLNVTEQVFDENYLEDQLYVSLSYQRLIKLPEEIKQTGFSYSFTVGFIKDIPLNRARNIGLGAGLGYNLNTHYFKVRNVEGATDDNISSSNKVVLNMVEFPVEFRIRNSSPSKYNFWRFYPGLKFNYSFYNSSNIKQSEDFDVFDVIDINDFQYGISLAAGFNKWNIYCYYGISDLFNESESYAKVIGVNEVKIGIIFYPL
ncbi:porin family protein [Namhaeicola litoreus]|uniref:Porin family protein n=1 Tax=Namhaeicola litoreus TaxID=1052145 RepID=A0ABW3XZG9_9FLAO